MGQTKKWGGARPNAKEKSKMQTGIIIMCGVWGRVVGGAVISNSN